MSTMKKQTHSDRAIIDRVGELIADGHGTYRPRLKADDFSGRVEIDDSVYWVKLRWPDSSEAHEITADIRVIK